MVENMIAQLIVPVVFMFIVLYVLYWVVEAFALIIDFLKKVVT